MTDTKDAAEALAEELSANGVDDFPLSKDLQIIGQHLQAAHERGRVEGLEEAASHIDGLLSAVCQKRTEAIRPDAHKAFDYGARKLGEAKKKVRSLKDRKEAKDG